MDTTRNRDFRLTGNPETTACRSRRRTARLENFESLAPILGWPLIHFIAVRQFLRIREPACVTVRNIR
jgi:hypothetical protein